MITTQITRDMIDRLRNEALQLAGKSVRVDARCIGWMPWQFYDRLDQAGGLVVVQNNGETVGFAAFDVDVRKTGQGRIYQAWVRQDARQIEHGRALVARVARELRGATLSLRCWVASDLEAMSFWPALGFSPSGERLGRGSVLAPLPGRPLRRHVLFTRELEVVHGRQSARGPAPADAGGSSVQGARADQATPDQAGAFG